MAARLTQGWDFLPHIAANEGVLYMIIAAAWLQTLAALFSTFSKTMIRLRAASVLANIFGLVVAIGTLNPATLLRHILILPVDLLRLHQMRKLVANVKNASKSDLNVEWLKPFMRARRFDKGAIIFRKGDVAEEAFLLVEGEIEIPELGSVLSPGVLFGELALFMPDRTRTATALCRTDIHLLSITYDQFEQLYFQNPEFGIYLLRLIASRLRSDLEKSVPIIASGAEPQA
jgi:hypothetical protein